MSDNINQNKKLFLGIDGGGSKTSFLIEDEDGNTIFYKESKGSSIDTFSYEEILANYQEVLSLPYKVDAIFAGIGGIASSEDIDNFNNLLRKLPIVKKDTIINSDNDVISALYGGLNGNDGIILIAGTGSVVYGKNNEKYIRVGGYGHKEGDPGSSYDLGFKALKYLAKVIDHRYEESDFSIALKEKINVYDYQGFSEYINHVTRSEIASLSKIVTLYQDNDYAKKIILEGVDEVILMIKTCFKELKFDESNKEVLFSVIGSLGNSNTLYKETLINRLNTELPNLKIIKKMNEAYKGSVIKAKELIK